MMKKRFHLILHISLAGAALLSVLAVTSYRKALEIDAEVLQPSLSSDLHYRRMAHFRPFDIWNSRSILPHWTITYAEEPAVIDYISPSITINILGQITDARSKEASSLLAEKGYRKR